MLSILESISAFVWGVPTLLLITITGLILTIRTHAFQLRYLPDAFRYLAESIRKSNPLKAEVSPYGALCAALGATVGTGNLAGVAGAIVLGGPGAVFWMWVSGTLGMIVKFAEVVLAMRYREKSTDGTWMGGPMYVICKGLPKKMHFLAYLYCFFGVAAIFGVGNTVQINTLLCSTSSACDLIGIKMEPVFLGVVLAVFIFFVFRGGGRRIIRLCEKIVPVAAGIYILISLYVLMIRLDRIPMVLLTIVKSAFCPEAFTGGVVGSMFITLRIGTARGVFTNEAGMGTASIAHAESNTADPVNQGLMGVLEVFLDTIVICTLTALAILCSGIDIPYGTDNGILMTMDAFRYACGDWTSIVICIVTSLLAIATVLGWGLYGGRCAQFLFGNGIWKLYPFIQAAAVMIGVLMDTSAVWIMSELVNGLMAVPNLIALFILSPQVVETVRAYSPK